MTIDEKQRKDWWDGLSEAERSRWLDFAWRQTEKAAGRISYTLDDMPTEADAWAEYKRRAAQGKPHALAPHAEPADAQAGMDWWNNSTEQQRGYWMKRAGNTGVAADAWAVYKAEKPRQR